MADDVALKQQTSSIQVEFDSSQPGLSSLSVDSLNRGSFRASPIVDAGRSPLQYTVSEKNGWTRYALRSDPEHTVWEMRCSGRVLQMRSFFQANGAAKDLTWKFDSNVTHATLLGHVTAAGDIALPALLHLPGMGSLRIYSRGSDFALLHYDAKRSPSAFVSITFPAATAQRKFIEYTLDTAAIFPKVSGISDDDPQFDGFRRDYLDVFQLHATYHVLANNSASDPCGFVLYMYSDMARYTPELVKGLTALDLVRDSLDRYLGGLVAYGMPGYSLFDYQNSPTQYVYASLDTYPSLLISAYDYADGSGDERWLRNNYPGLRKWAEKLMTPNADGSPLLEFPASGNSGSWTTPVTVRPANWWDTIGFGHQDAYSNALGYRALRGMAVLADRAGESADGARYRKRAQEIHDAYASAFFDPESGVLAGWRSGDGQLHNYFFPFVNGITVRYGLLSEDRSRQVMDRILAKMKSVGYTDFELGIPGNLVPIRRVDYVDFAPRAGGPSKEDGSDSFGVYENGGATACFAYFTLAALYQLGETGKGDKILMPMLDAFTRQGFSGHAPNGMTYDWKDWHGNAYGYEGFLVDNYYVLLAVLDRANLVVKMP